MSAIMENRRPAPAGARRHHRHTPAAPAPTLMRECDRSPALFDLPEPAEVASTANPLAGTDGIIPLSAVAEQASATARFAQSAKKAVDACRRCPFLQSCRREATERVLAGQRPQGEVRAAVAFNAEGMPEPAVHAKPRRRDLEQLTLDLDLGLSGAAVTAETDWLPADLEPVATFDDLAVTLALDEVRVNSTVTQSHLDSKPGADAGGRIVLNYRDELEVVRRGLTTGNATNRLAQILGVKWQKVAELAHILGRTPEGKFIPKDWAIMRRALSDADTIRVTTTTAAAVREQQARDRIAIRRDHDHERALEIADRRGIRLVTGPPPLSSRILRTEAVLDRTASLSHFAGLSRAS